MAREYGIGRVPVDVDPVEEELAELEAERLQPTPPAPKGRTFMTCRHCRQTGYTGDYPFSTLASSGLCDDCL